MVVCDALALNWTLRPVRCRRGLRGTGVAVLAVCASRLGKLAASLMAFTCAGVGSVDWTAGLGAKPLRSIIVSSASLNTLARDLPIMRPASIYGNVSSA